MVNMKKYHVFKVKSILGVILFLFSSCNIKHTITLEEDFSGDSSIAIDASEMINTLRSFMPDSVDRTNEQLLGNRDVDSNMVHILQKFNKIDGLSNFHFTNQIDVGKINYSFSFNQAKNFTKGIAVLANEDISTIDLEQQFFIWGKDSLMLDFTAEALRLALGENENMDDLNEYNLGEYHFVLNFPFPIQSINNQKYQLSADKKTISVSVPVEQLLTDIEALNVLLTW